MIRKLILASAWCVAATTCSADVPWLVDVNTPPDRAEPQSPGRLDEVLRTKDGFLITTLADWQDRQQELLSEWRAFLGPMPDPRPSVKLEVLKSEVIGKVTRQLIRYEGEPGTFVEAYLLLPESYAGSPESYQPQTPFPAIVALHPTTDSSIDEIAGISGREHMHSGLMLAERGFVVICPRCFLWQNASSLNDAVAQHRKRHPNTLGMAKMLYDAQRAVDVLESLPAVEKDRIGAFGHSLGAKEVLYLAAFDDRIKASVSSEGGLGYRSTNWDAEWYLGSAIRDENFPLNHHQLIATIAPRPFLVLGGEAGKGAADGLRSWSILRSALPAWKLYGEPLRVGLLNHHEGHLVSATSFEKSCEWLRTYLAKRP